MGISIEELRKLEKDSYQILDIRNETEISHGAIPGAIAVAEDAIDGHPEIDFTKKLVVCQPKGVKFKSDENIIIGNVALYGATSGKAFVGGVAGERFAVRNSGARAVVEGVGDHGCEYMTGGCVVVLGQVGKNFAAGMSGGIAYVIDLDNSLYRKVNKAMVNIERVTDKYDVQELKGMIQEHVAYTNSEVGKKILDNFKEYLPKFKKIIPEDYERMMSTIIQMEEKGLSREKAKIEAFNMIKNGR